MSWDEIEAFFICAILGFFTNWLAWRNKFFVLQKNLPIPIEWKEVFGVFLIYIGSMLLLGPWLFSLLINLYAPSPPPLGLSANLQLFLTLFMILLLFLFCQAKRRSNTSSPSLWLTIWKDQSYPYKKSILYDIGMGVMAWFISYPLVAAVGEFFDMAVYIVMSLEHYEQVAIRYLKDTLSSPSQLTIALFTILILAPSIEEFLFRGCLQNFLKNHFGVRSSILLTSLAFSLFHFSGTQGLGNIPLITSLFTFACFLGVVYERQQSLFASMALHLTFNLVSTLRILFVPEG